MNLKLFKKKQISVKNQKKRENSVFFIWVFLLTLFAYPIIKTLIDLNILLSTGRLIGTDDWLNLTISHQEKIAANVLSDQRKILIVSGSNALFGLSAKQISQTTGIKAINLASHAGLGGEYILSRSQKLINQGDIVLLPLEYPFYSSPGISYDFNEYMVLSKFIISYDPKSLSKISPISFLTFVLENACSWPNYSEYQNFFRGDLSRKVIDKRLQQQRILFGCYSGLTLNEYGDETCNIGKDDAPTLPTISVTALPHSLGKIDPGGYLKTFIEVAREKGAILIPLYPVSTRTDDYQNPSFQASAQTIKTFWEEQNIPFLDSLENSLLAPELMYDTNYHPKDNGRKKRTQIIIDLINQQLNY
ncbi:hypothetical protein [Crocosphaera sp.]|uniref:hypothetical protein n=1 Tax=Crocosphaera sp. TaxID=2729996 RepID=UPI00261747E1|nr:hypothetical protein [Crocosphaera sp.]MDJ0579614.1 hypothetical protein [Crocosphaera sp.]